jgi:hypothetical protein
MSKVKSQPNIATIFSKNLSKSSNEDKINVQPNKLVINDDIDITSQAIKLLQMPTEKQKSKPIIKSERINRDKLKDDSEISITSLMNAKIENKELSKSQMKEKTKAVTERLAKTNINTNDKLTEMKNKLKTDKESIEKGVKEKSNKQVKNASKDELTDDIRSKSVDTLNAKNSDNKRLNSPNRNQNSDTKKKNNDTEQPRGISLDVKTNTLSKNKQTSSQLNILVNKNKKVQDEKAKLSNSKKDKLNDKREKSVDSIKTDEENKSVSKILDLSAKNTSKIKSSPPKNEQIYNDSY